MAHRVGAVSVLVLTSETKEHDVPHSPSLPDYVMSGRPDLYGALARPITRTLVKAVKVPAVLAARLIVWKQDYIRQ